MLQTTVNERLHPKVVQYGENASTVGHENMRGNRLKHRRAFGALVAISMVALLIPGGAAGARDGRTRSSDGIRQVSPDEMKGRTLDVSRPARINARPVHEGGRLGIGDERLWLAADFTGGDYVKEYTLRGKSEHVEIWAATDRDEVSNGLKFPEGDCRNDIAKRIKVTAKKVRHFKRQFERKIYPKMSRNFSRPVKRNGENAYLQTLLDRQTKREYGIDAHYWEGSGKRVVVLIDNIRDENFYDTDNANTLSRVAGFHYGFFNEAFDRNVMTIDSFNWLANTRATPPHEPNPNDPCTNYPANPFQYEATFAHEYQHLLEYYQDPDGESTWVDEGLADWAQTVTGYARPGEPLESVFFDSHVQCFLGYLEQQAEYNPIPAENCGPENSLTAWRDQNDNEIEILADYGAAYTFMELLAGRYGRPFMKALHKDDANSFASLNSLLDAEGTGTRALDLVHEWLVAMAVDKLLDGGATLTGGVAATYQVPTLNAQVDWFNDDAYMTPGAPPNGGDFVLARKNATQYLGADKIDSITFNGAEELAAGFTVQLVAWTADGTQVRIGELPLDAQFDGTLSGAALDAIIGTTAENVGIIVTQDDPTAEQRKYAAYTLEVDNFAQPGGS